MVTRESETIISDREYNYQCKDNCFHTFIGYSATGNVTGTVKDYEPNKDHSGHICLAKMQNLTYGVVGMLAQRDNCIGLMVYPDLDIFEGFQTTDYQFGAANYLQGNHNQPSKA